MNNIILSTFVFMCSFQMALGQSPTIMKSNGLFETSKYYNQILAFDDGFFVLFASRDTKSKLILSKYDQCNNHLWTKSYSSNFDLSVHDVLFHNEKLVILFVTHFNSSTTRTPILLALDMEGELKFSYRYNKDQFDNFINLSQHDNQYHIMGPSSGAPSGGGHFVINEFGDLIYSNIIRDTMGNGGSSFGCVTLKNGIVIRRNNSTLIACDIDQNIIWAKRIVNSGFNDLSETKPLVLDDGFVHFFRNQDKIVLFKVDYNGNIDWSISCNGKHYNTQPAIFNDEISFIWLSLNSDGKYIPNYTKIDQSDGTILFNKLIETDDGNIINWPCLSTNVTGDFFITASVDVDDVLTDYVYINPHLSGCTILCESTEFSIFDLDLVDVTSQYEIVPVSVTQNEVEFTIADMESIVTLECSFIDNIEIDTGLDCSNSFIFNGNIYGSEFLWSDGRTDSVRTFNEAQEVSVLIGSCQTEKQIHININKSNCDCQIYVPNIVSRSAKNIENQKMTVYSNCDFTYYSFYIFDRWGNLVFQSYDSLVPWIPNDSSKLSQGVYTWLLKSSSLTNLEIQIKTGTITYLR